MYSPNRQRSPARIVTPARPVTGTGLLDRSVSKMIQSISFELSSPLAIPPAPALPPPQAPTYPYPLATPLPAGSSRRSSATGYSAAPPASLPAAPPAKPPPPYAGSPLHPADSSFSFGRNKMDDLTAEMLTQLSPSFELRDDRLEHEVSGLIASGKTILSDRSRSPSRFSPGSSPGRVRRSPTPTSSLAPPSFHPAPSARPISRTNTPTRSLLPTPARAVTPPATPILAPAATTRKVLFPEGGAGAAGVAGASRAATPPRTPSLRSSASAPLELDSAARASVVAAEERARRSVSPTASYTTTNVTKDYMSTSNTPLIGNTPILGPSQDPVAVYSPGFRDALRDLAARGGAASPGGSPGRQQRLRQLLEPGYLTAGVGLAEYASLPQQGSPGRAKTAFVRRAREVSHALEDFQRAEGEAAEGFLKRVAQSFDQVFGA